MGWELPLLSSVAQALVLLLQLFRGMCNVSFETWHENKLQQIAVLCKMSIFMRWHDGKRNNILLGYFFAMFGSG